jgi:ABC-type Mn2+/Zn2+ transport system permease subunit
MVCAALPSPLDLVELPFMRTAVLELILLAFVGGLLGTWIVLRRLAFFTHAVGSATFPGLVVANAASFSPQLAGLAMGLAYAGGVERAGRSHRDPGDAATALLLVAALATGVILAGDVFESGSEVDRLLFGTLLGLGPGDVVLSGAAAALALAAALTLGRAWTALAFDPAGASSLGLPTARIDLMLLALIACSAVAAIPAVGALLASSILVLPAATALLVARSVPQLAVAAVAIAAVEGLGGLYLALWLDVPPGPAVATLAAGVYGVVALAAWRFRS